MAGSLPIAASIRFLGRFLGIRDSWADSCADWPRALNQVVATLLCQSYNAFRWSTSIECASSPSMQPAAPAMMSKHSS